MNAQQRLKETRAAIAALQALETSLVMEIENGRSRGFKGALPGSIPIHQQIAAARGYVSNTVEKINEVL
ncbi:hypothetical protein PS2_045 [Serratia phage PS2]|uniref:Uncharacterized protein n=1 Tax=Serratia phage PS2 TaxID=1481112 RepID=A0A023W4X5_9CAUD|nr:hypothetical protein FF83_gp045 [Serratia phage PS2]AHY25295.1 hypothetical protein PS2_045 [Serratia phage PS2]